MREGGRKEGGPHCRWKPLSSPASYDQLSSLDFLPSSHLSAHATVRQGARMMAPGASLAGSRLPALSPRPVFVPVGPHRLG